MQHLKSLQFLTSQDYATFLKKTNNNYETTQKQETDLNLGKRLPLPWVSALGTEKLYVLLMSGFNLKLIKNNYKSCYE